MVHAATPAVVDAELHADLAHEHVVGARRSLAADREPDAGATGSDLADTVDDVPLRVVEDELFGARHARSALLLLADEPLGIVAVTVIPLAGIGINLRAIIVVCTHIFCAPLAATHRLQIVASRRLA